MVTPLEKNMRGVDDANKQSGKNPPSETEPEGREDNREIVKSLVDVMQRRSVEWCQVVE
jgi:hypothetical protein